MPNRLAAETSPYLLQHADNPVEWWPWCEDALSLARQLDKPILLSIGYSACHWCHVMAHESFEDPDVAALMNRLFVNIKVDREERPDLDQIYQTAHQMLAQRSGGWPLTMFLTPDGTPFFGGTYFPKQARYGLPGFASLLEQIAAAYAGKRREIEEHNAAVRAALARAASIGGGTHHSDFGPQPIAKLRDLLSANFDVRFGGFGGAPKFPHPTDLEFLLHRHRSTGDGHARDMALDTLTRMAEGGLFDQLGGGFCRYSTDDRWQIPHFEKMLYDNGPLLALYADAWQISGDPLFRRVVEDTAAWVMREMQSAEGGYVAALDADSEGEEGRFYAWDRDEIRALLTPDAFAVAERHYGLDAPPNFEHRHWHLVVSRPLDQVANELGIRPDDAARLLADARALLFEERAARIRPGRDDKILTSWNGLMIAGMMHAARVFRRADWAESARRAIDFIRDRHWRDGRLYATSTGGDGRLNAYLDDHAFMIGGLIEALQTRFTPGDLAFAEDLADELLEQFEDRAAGGFFFTRHDHEALIQRPKPLHDNATASGNGVAIRTLARLGHVTGELRYHDAAERGLQAFYGALAGNPGGCAGLALALAEHLVPPALVIVRGKADDLIAWQQELAGMHLPDTLSFALPPGIAHLPPVLDKPVDADVTAWVCRGTQCLAPVHSLHALTGLLATPA
ncbi:thioredoxin domain-containing protein [Rhodocyclaceae bacterium SMB388]